MGSVLRILGLTPGRRPVRFVGLAHLGTGPGESGVSPIAAIGLSTVAAPLFYAIRTVEGTILGPEARWLSRVPLTA